jgi:exosortase D (VPLPA-CTERM-specific)
MSINPAMNGVAVWRFSWGLVLFTLIAGVFSLLPFWDGLTEMWGTWMDSPEYSHGLLIPPVAAFLIWQHKDRLERIPFTGSWSGVGLTLLAGVFLFMGQIGAVYAFVQYAYVLALCGLILSFLGWPAFRLIAVPLLILWLMIPLPAFVLNNLSTKLQLLSSQIGVWFIRLFDISVFLEGNVIDLGGYKLQVAEACSGLRYLFPLMTIGFLMAYLYKGALWKRIVLFLSSIPITVFMNSLRIGIIGVTVDRWGTEMAEGFLHEFQGWMIFMLSAGLMLGEMALLNRIGHESGSWRQLFGVEFPARSPPGARIERRMLPAPFVAACGALVVFIGITLWVPRPTEVLPSRTSFLDFPMRLGPWSGQRDSLEGVYLDELRMDDYILADYVDGAGSPVNLYIAYYNSQRKGESVHSPRACLPGGGWQMRDFDQRTLSGVVMNGVPLRVNRTLIELGNDRQLVYYWFQQRGRVITNEFVVKWYLFWDALTRHRADGAMVRLIVALPKSASEADADRRLADIAGRIAPSLNRYVPD